VRRSSFSAHDKFGSETVYGLCALDLKRDGPVVIEAPAMLLGGITDLWQREIMGIGPTANADGRQKNWIQTMPGKGWFTLFRFYGPLEPFFDQRT
jgi:hypothetical protein